MHQVRKNSNLLTKHAGESALPLQPSLTGELPPIPLLAFNIQDSMGLTHTHFWQESPTRNQAAQENARALFFLRYALCTTLRFSRQPMS